MNQDFKELLSAFNAQRVEYLVVGAHALASHGHVRATKDLDVWIKPEEKQPSRENLRKYCRETTSCRTSGARDENKTWQTSTGFYATLRTPEPSILTYLEHNYGAMAVSPHR